MTIQAQVSVYSPVFVAREYDIFAGLDVDHHSIAVTFTDHRRLMQSLRLPYSARQLLNYVGKHFPGQRLAFVYEAGPTGFGLYDESAAAGHACSIEPAHHQHPRQKPNKFIKSRSGKMRLSSLLD